MHKWHVRLGDTAYNKHAAGFTFDSLMWGPHDDYSWMTRSDNSRATDTEQDNIAYVFEGPLSVSGESDVDAEP